MMRDPIFAAVLRDGAVASAAKYIGFSGQATAKPSCESPTPGVGCQFDELWHEKQKEHKAGAVTTFTPAAL